MTSPRGSAPPVGNRDVSIECRDLTEWLSEIGRHRVVRSDRAHVVIAGAMHVQRDAIPLRVQRRVAIADAIVEPVDDLEEPGHAVDYLVLVSGEEE